ncbi:MAG: PIN domain-containing protein [archaeon]|nr:PIN domain-containing protein [archaeon]
MQKFLDSYAIIEILKANPNYEKVSMDSPFTSKANLVEVAYHLLQDFSQDKAIEIFDALKINILEIQESQIMKIALFRKTHSKKKLSYIDCIGYIIAKENGMKFLTGDQQFKEMENVEFVK